MNHKLTMKQALSCILLACATSLAAQGPWKTRLWCPQEKINLNIDLYEESITVPTMEDFGSMNGYLDGNVYGVWTVTSFSIKDDHAATINLSNDLGSETQEALLTQLTDSTWSLKFTGRNVVKRVSGKKLVKIPSELIMMPKK